MRAGLSPGPLLLHHAATSELQTQGHLNHSRSAGVSAVEGRRAAQGAECAVVLRAVTSQHGEVRVVEGVEEIRPVLELQALVYLEGLRRRCIEADQAGENPSFNAFSWNSRCASGVAIWAEVMQAAAAKIVAAMNMELDRNTFSP